MVSRTPFWRFYFYLNMSAMVSLSKLSNTPNVKVNVKPNVNVNVGTPPTAPTTAPEGMLSTSCQVPKELSVASNAYDVNYAPQEPGTVCYPPKEAATVPKEHIYSETEYNKLKNENEVLKTIIDIQRNNPIIYNGYILADDIKLMKFIQLLTFADDVQLDVEDLGQGCLTKKTYRKIHAIYVIKDGETKNLKYDYPRVMKELTDLGISTKFVW